MIHRFFLGSGVSFHQLLLRLLVLLMVGSTLLAAGCSSGGSSSSSSDDVEISDVVDTDESTETEEETSETVSDVADADFEATDWTDETHSKSADPNFAEVFDATQVKRLDIVVTAERWESMLVDMTELYGEFGVMASFGGQTRGPGVVVASPATDVISEENDEDPIFVPAEIYYNGLQWYRVGIRFKGNSSLQSSWQQGVLKLSFKLDFDEFEDDYPQIKNQRFYGFKQLSLKNNYDDPSLLREKVATDVFMNAGMAVSHTAFYALYVDHGDGAEFFGLYTMVEEVDDTVIDTQFSSDDGNLYKPEDGSANFVDGTFDEEDFDKKTNEDDADWSDIEALFSALHAESHDSDPASWRSDLEAVFDVDGFIRYLAVNGVIQNWDTYGRMAHNYYLYNNPETSKLTWIPWDHNEALQDGKLQGALALDFSDLQGSSWPLIEKIYTDETYKERYDIYVRDVIDNAFDVSTMQATYDSYAELVEPYAQLEREGYSFLTDMNDFYQGIEDLYLHVSDRATAAENYLSDQ